MAGLNHPESGFCNDYYAIISKACRYSKRQSVLGVLLHGWINHRSTHQGTLPAETSLLLTILYNLTSVAIGISKVKNRWKKVEN